MTAVFSAGTMRGPCAVSGEVYEVTPPVGVRATLPFGTQVIASFWPHGVDTAGAGRLKLRIDNSGGKMRTLACANIPPPQSDKELAVMFGKSGALARVQLMGSRADVIYVFLPPSRVV